MEPRRLHKPKWATDTAQTLLGLQIPSRFQQTLSISSTFYANKERYQTHSLIIHLTQLPHALNEGEKTNEEKVGSVRLGPPNKLISVNVMPVLPFFYFDLLHFCLLIGYAWSVFIISFVLFLNISKFLLKNVSYF